MSKIAFLVSAAAGTLGLAAASFAAQQSSPSIPDFQSNNVSWIAINSDFTGIPGGPQPVTFDAKFPFLRNDQATQAKANATYRVADTNNPNLKPWVVDELKRYNEKVFAGEIGTTPRWSCLPGGVPGFSIFVVEAVYIIQSPKEVHLVYTGDHQIRHVYMNVAHSTNPTPSWYGESVGHYEGDTLVVDTIGLSPKAVIDNYHTPHTEQLHVVERYRVIEDGKKLEVSLTVEDPGAFYAPWKAVQIYDRTMRGPQPEQNCSENNFDPFDLKGFAPPPSDDTPDF